MKILIVNGPNLNLLGKRNAEHYGELTLENIENSLLNAFPNILFDFFQSNIEGEIIEKIQNASDADGIIINPGGFAHTSVAIKDALELFKNPKIEVHLSHLANREDYRQKLITSTACDGYISGFKEKGYLAAVFLMKMMKEN